MNKTCIVILAILVTGCYSTPVQRTRRQSETATEVSEEKELSLEKLETFDSESKDKPDSVPAAAEVVESDKEKVGDDKNNDSEEIAEIGEAEEEDSEDEDESDVAPKGVQELYQESKAEFEKNDKEEESGAKKESAPSDSENDDELQSAIGNVAPGGMFSGFSQMWQTVTTLGSSWDHWMRIFNAFTSLAGF